MFKRAEPLPLSRLPRESTPHNVDFPTSALPKTANLKHKNKIMLELNKNLPYL